MNDIKEIVRILDGVQKLNQNVIEMLEDNRECRDVILRFYRAGLLNLFAGRTNDGR